MSSSNELSMDELTLKEILAEQIEEAKATRKYITKLERSIADRDQVIKDILVSFEQKTSDLKVEIPKPDLSEVTATLDVKLTNIQQAVERKPVPVIRQFRFLLFPETNTEHYYKIIFGRILPWLVIVLISTYLFSLGSDWLNNQQVIELQEIETNISARAWSKLYDKANKRDKKKLDELWERARKKTIHTPTNRD
ncbi:hypothetical protein QE417_002677 [Mucilaginibacter terrae]|uniref:Uncharacterized protein n=2 Tax=Mucilaginibacter terrae TaxID=1955052 RepID=A0ABU3GV05_9SPHI|nr:hypothetical protein [Mucilaginibacter terrae]